MGRKLDALLGRSFKTSKLKATLNLAIYRVSVLKNQRHARCSVSHSDVIEFLNLGHRDRALLRVEQVIKEQNMLDVFTMIEGYCHMLIERINLMGQDKECPEELKEAASSLIYATTRCGEFPELQEIRAIFTSRFGKEFAARAVDLRNNCGVNPQIIQKLSTRMPSLKQKTKVVKEIASEYNIILQIEETPSATEVEIQDSHKENQQMQKNPGQNSVVRTEDIERVEYLSDSVKMRKKYKDVADAAQAAFESAAYAAEAARAAVKLSRSGSTDPDDPSSPRKKSDILEPLKSKLQTDEEMKVELNKKQTKFSRSPSDSSLDSEDDNVKKTNMSLDEMRQSQPTESKMVFDESDDESITPFSKDFKDEMPEGSGENPHLTSHRLNFADEIKPHLNVKKSPISVWTKRTYGR